MHDKTPSRTGQQQHPARTEEDFRWQERAQQIAAELGQPPILEVLFSGGNSFMARFDTTRDTLIFQRDWMNAVGGPGTEAATWTIHHELGHRKDKRALGIVWRTSFVLLLAIPGILLAWGVWRSISDALENDLVFETNTLLPAVAASLFGVAIVASLRWLFEFRADDFAADVIGHADGLQAAFDAAPATFWARKGSPTHPPRGVRVRRQRRRHPREA